MTDKEKIIADSLLDSIEDGNVADQAKAINNYQQFMQAAEIRDAIERSKIESPPVEDSRSIKG